MVCRSPLAIAALTSATNSLRRSGYPRPSCAAFSHAATAAAEQDPFGADETVPALETQRVREGVGQAVAIEVSAGRGEWRKGDAGVVERQQVARLGLLPVVRVVLFRVVLSVTGRAALVADLHRVRRRGEPILAINPNSSPVTHALFMTLPFEMGRTVTLCDSR